MTLPPLGPARSDGHDKDSEPQVPYYSLWTGPKAPAVWRPARSAGSK